MSNDNNLAFKELVNQIDRIAGGWIWRATLTEEALLAAFEQAIKVHDALKNQEGSASINKTNPDENGYYEVILDLVTDKPNSSSAVFPPETLFRSVSSFNRRIAGGVAFGEMGTPKQDPEESSDSFYSRYIGVIERDVALMSGKIDIKSQEDGTVVLMGKVKPLRTPHGAMLEEMLKNPPTVNFAIRALQKSNELVFVTIDVVAGK